MTYIDQIPPNIKTALDLHAECGRRCGSFVTAVLENDFATAIGCADDDSMAALKQIAIYVHCNLPSPCHGSESLVAIWRRSFDDPATAERNAALARSVREGASFER